MNTNTSEYDPEFEMGRPLFILTSPYDKDYLQLYLMMWCIQTWLWMVVESNMDKIAVAIFYVFTTITCVGGMLIEKHIAERGRGG